MSFSSLSDLRKSRGNFDSLMKEVEKISKPAVDSGNDDYTLDPTSGAAAIGAGLGNYNSYVDIGAVQSQSGGGGGSATLASAWVG